MRCFQPQGLSGKALAFIDEKIKEAGGRKFTRRTTLTFEDGEVSERELEGIESSVKTTYHKSIDYFYGEEYSFQQWEFLDGTIIKEVEQACPWSSGPMLFTCLEDKDGVLIHEWDEEEIEGML